MQGVNIAFLLYFVQNNVFKVTMRVSWGIPFLRRNNVTKQLIMQIYYE
jgi:hypothetical protein